MIAVDTNVLIRAFVEDDARQSILARKFFVDRASADSPAWVSIVALVEAIWLLKSRFGFGNAELRAVVSGLLDSAEIVVENRALVSAALALEIDFADALIHVSGRAAGCMETVTFDKRFARQPGVELLA